MSKKSKDKQIICKECVLFEVDGIYREVESISLKTVEPYTYMSVNLKPRK